MLYIAPMKVRQNGKDLHAMSLLPTGYAEHKEEVNMLVDLH